MNEESEGKSTRKKSQAFRLGDIVRIISGPFVSLTGKIEGINQARALLKVKVAIYGRNSPIKLSFSDVEKVSGPDLFTLHCPRSPRTLSNKLFGGGLARE